MRRRALRVVSLVFVLAVLVIVSVSGQNGSSSPLPVGRSGTRGRGCAFSDGGLRIGRDGLLASGPQTPAVGPSPRLPRLAGARREPFCTDYRHRRSPRAGAGVDLRRARRRCQGHALDAPAQYTD
jgi:hypothetical protein